MQRIVLWAGVVWGIYYLFCSSWATAGLIVPSSNGTALYSGGAKDQNGDTIDFVRKMDAWSSFGGKFFGRARSDFGDGIYVSEDGNINFTNDNNFFPINPSYVPRIAPLWDDFLFDTTTTNRVLTHQSTGYIGATWENVKLSFELVAGNSSRSFQTLWFDQDTHLRGFDFKADDIAFSYAGEVIRNIDPEQTGSLHASFVGLQSGGNPGTNVILSNTQNGDGLLFDGDTAKLGLGSALGENDFLLFRASGSTYTLSRHSLTAVPEPSSLLCAAIGSGLLSLFAAWRKRKMKNSHSASVI
ncbi:MAG: PEP-CTERM sorting domain-containing protein [Pirellula sp.]|jgi:hypothetical protein